MIQLLSVSVEREKCLRFVALWCIVLHAVESEEKSLTAAPGVL